MNIRNLKWVFGGVFDGRWQIITYLLHSQIFEHLEQFLSEVSECNGAVVRESVLNKHVAIKSAHFVDGENAYSAERLGRNGKDLALGNVSVQMVIGSRLQTVESDVSGDKVAFQGAVCNFDGKRTRHYLLIFHGRVANLGRAGISAMEAHKGVRKVIGEFSLDKLVEHILGNGVVDVKQGNGVAADASADVFG